MTHLAHMAHLAQLAHLAHLAHLADLPHLANFAHLRLLYFRRTFLSFISPSSGGSVGVVEWLVEG